MSAETTTTAAAKQQSTGSKQQAAIDKHQGMFLVPVQVAQMTCKCCKSNKS